MGYFTAMTNKRISIVRMLPFFGLLLLLIPGNLLAQSSAPDVAATQAVMRDIASKIGKVAGFSATVESEELAPGSPSGKSVGSLMVSRLYGWKITVTGLNPYTMLTDFHTLYQYYPKERRVMKTTATNAEIKMMMTKPVTDMNPVALLDPATVQFLGEEVINGETVYHVTGTTQSQLMPGGPLVLRTVSAWLSSEDGLPRKTIESVGSTTGTTVYREVKINPDLKPEDFAFTPPAGVTVIDTNEQIRKLEERINAGQPLESSH